MKYLQSFVILLLAVTITSCGVKNNSGVDAKHEERDAANNEPAIETIDYSALIKTVYEKFVFVIDADSKVYTHPEQYFTANALNKLRDSYEFDCENKDCYAFYELRTQEQDSKPDTDGDSEIYAIENMGEDWYVVSYSDMGWPGMTRIKIKDGKIDDYERCVKDL